MTRWIPTDRQREFLACPAYEALYGGAAGGGKSEALVMGALRWVHLPSYRAIILRRTFPELDRDIIPLSQEYYRWANGEYNVSAKTWRFPSGAVIEFGHIEAEADVHKYQGLEVQYLAFDELTTFTEKQYCYLLSRVRSAHKVPVRVRAATNPGGIGHEWVKRRWAPWLETDDNIHRLQLPRAAPRQTLAYRNTQSGEVYGNGRLSRVFFPAKVEDNPHIANNDPDYTERLMGLDALTRAQLLYGDWQARAVAGLYFRREWFRFVDVPTIKVKARVRRWDLASTEGAGDWTVGVKLAQLEDGTFIVEDVQRVQLGPRGVRALVKTTAELDGVDCHVVIPQDPGQAGKDQAQEYTTLLTGFVVRTTRETGDKITRAGPASAQAEAKNIALVRATWNEPFLAALEAFPNPAFHDDDVDALAGAVTYLAKPLTTADYWSMCNENS